MQSNDFVQRVESRAYEIYAQRGYGSGRDWDDWFEAEKEIGAEMNCLEKDCLRSESFYEVTHRSLGELPSGLKV